MLKRSLRVLSFFFESIIAKVYLLKLALKRLGMFIDHVILICMLLNIIQIARAINATNEGCLVEFIWLVQAKSVTFF